MCCTTPPHPPPQRLLLANHHTTLLYLGHSNVLLLSPLADALCCNLRKIGWEEERSEESGRREGVVTEARSFLPPKKFNNVFCDFYSNAVYVFSFLSFFLPPFHPSLFSSLRCKRFIRPAAAARASFLHQPLHFPRFYS